MSAVPISLVYVNIVSPSLVPYAQLASLALAIFGAVVIARNLSAKPKRRSWSGIAMLFVAASIELVLLLVALLTLRMGQSDGYTTPVYLILNTIPFISLAFGIFGAVLIGRGLSEAPKRRSLLGVSLIAVSVVAELSLLVFAIATLNIPLFL